MLIFGFWKMWYGARPYFHENSTTSMTQPLHSMDLMRQMLRMLLIWSKSFLPVMPHQRPMILGQDL